jgi:CRP-like cAMP-binding protein
MVGYEGMLGVSVVLGSNKSPHQVMVQVPGSALRMKSVAAKHEFDCHGALHDLLLRYTHALLTEISQSVACSRFHMVEERLCRWLLVTSDRVRSNSFSLTQEFLSYMLGTRREGVTLAMGDLKRLGLIHHVPGQIAIIDREGLERASCECYRIVRDAYIQTLGV